MFISEEVPEVLTLVKAKIYLLVSNINKSAYKWWDKKPSDSSKSSSVI